MNRQAWTAFWFIGLIWGSSFLLIRVGVRELRPIEVVFIRTSIAAIGLGLVIALRRVPIPTDWRNIRALIIIGLGNVVAPFVLISWGEQHIASGVAAVLQSTAALFTLVVAHFAFTDERITTRKIVGLLTGFVGVIVLFSRELTSTGGEAATLGLLGQLAIVVASAFYATFTTYSRKIIQGSVEPVILSGSTMLVAALATAPFALFAEGGFTPLRQAVSSDVLVSVVILGFLNTFIAYLFYYFVVRELGASRASMVTYIVPVVGVILGALLLAEEVGLPLVIGTALIFVGIGIVNLRRPARRQITPAAPIVENITEE
ncbi:MAG: DMT family transporter [Anaerolineae bacterium]|nr:DMT family transporter [Anaerolineae bacterium]